MGNNINLSDEQQLAVDHSHDSSAIVAAAAGSGKTTLLVARVIRLLSDRALDIPADSLAIMTFTRNATSRMREKLNNALAKELNLLAGSDTEEGRLQYDYLKKQMIALRQASISTIDAFCLKIIKENAEAFDLPLNLSIADNARKAVLQTHALTSTFQKFYGSEFTDDERNTLFYTFSFEDDKMLEKAILSVAEKLSSFTDPDKWINDTADVYKDVDSVEKRYLPLLDKFLDSKIRFAAHCLDLYTKENVYDGLENEVRERRENGGNDSSLDNTENEILPPMKQIIDADRKRISQLVRDHEEYKKAPSIELLGRLIKNLEENSEDLPKIDLRKGLRSEFKTVFGNISKSITKTVSALLDIKVDRETEEKILPDVRNATTSFLKLLRIYMNFYRLEKMTSGCIDFSDCERELYNKLNEDEDFRRQLSKRFKCIIVDEFQDSNKIQAEIFRLLGERHLFYVGDVKQSIYAFRGADPYIMADLCENDDSFKTYPLNTNFRSREAVVNTVNAAFDGLMTPDYGGVEYSRERLKHGCDIPESPNKKLYESEIHLIKYKQDENGDTPEDEKDMTLPKYVAQSIKQLYDNEDFLVSDGKDENGIHKFRRLKYSDVIVLLRTKSKIKYYRKALEELGVPSVAPKGSNFFEADEIFLAYNYLKVIDNPMLDEEMLKILMSPIYRFTAEEVAKLKMGILGLEGKSEDELRKIADKYRNRSLFTCINDTMSQAGENSAEKTDAQKNDPKRTVPQKLERFYNDLKAFRYYMGSNSLDNLVRKIYEDTDLIAVVAAFEDSAGRVENVRQLQRLASDFEADRGGGLGDFLRFFDRAKENSSKGIEEAARPESSANAVRIMTFHGSKGLEAPVCILTEMYNSMNSSDYSGSLLVNDEHLMALKHTDIKHRCKTKTLAYHALSRFIRNRLLGDELRLLYVAMTRAQEKLIMVSTIGEKYFSNIKNYIDSKKPDPEFNDEIYDNSTPFMCVLGSLFRNAPEIDKAEKSFSFNCFECSFTAVDLNAKTISDSETPEKDDKDNKEVISVSEERVKKITELMHLEYEHIKDTRQQAKFTTTELAHKRSVRPISLTRPVFANGGKVSGVEKGNAYHHCMHYFPFERLNTGMSLEETVPVVEKALDELAEKRKITADERKIIEAKRVAKFFRNELGQRVLRAFSQDPDNVKREQPIYSEVIGYEVQQDYDGRISIQGQIDMYFIENGEIVVVDYKSDTEKNLEKELDSYASQVKIYMKILNNQTGMEVKEMYLYAFIADKEMKIS